LVLFPEAEPHRTITLPNHKTKNQKPKTILTTASRARPSSNMSWTQAWHTANEAQRTQQKQFVCVCVCVFVCVCRPNLSKHAQTARSNNYVLPLCDRTMSSACEFCVCVCVCECTGGLKRRARGGAEDSARSASVNGHGIEGSQGHSYPLSSAHSGVFCAHCWRS